MICSMRKLVTIDSEVDDDDILIWDSADYDSEEAMCVSIALSIKGEPSSSHFDPHVWFSNSAINYTTGEDIEISFHWQDAPEHIRERVFNLRGI